MAFYCVRLYAVGSFVRECKHYHTSRESAERCATKDATEYPSAAFEWLVVEKPDGPSQLVQARRGYRDILD